MDAGQFRQIAHRQGGQNEAFEELCCQIARNTLPDEVPFVRLRGSGGDGGVECYADFPNGSRKGWQAKFVFDTGSLIKQVSQSLDTALKIHRELTCFVVCFPFDPTGSTGRRGKSGVSKLREWKKSREAAARKSGHRLVIELWSASQLLSELLKHDENGGMRAYFFNETVLSKEWFNEHLSSASATAGPRYTPEVNVETDMWKWLCALGQSDTWKTALQTQLKVWEKCLSHLEHAVERKTGGSLDPIWPDSMRTEGESCVGALAEVRNTSFRLLDSPSRDRADMLRTQLSRGLSIITELEGSLVEDFDARHGTGRSDSPSFRQFMAEYECSFPAANLDATREMITVTQQLLDWLRSPTGWSGFESVLLLLGAAGSGKTHGICDAAVKRLRENLLSIVVFGHEFNGEPDPWIRLRESLGLPSALSRDSLLDALNSAGEASGYPLVIFLDAINETKPLSYWRKRLSSFIKAIQTRSFLRLCVACRSSYREHCTPDPFNQFEAEHCGFVGFEQVACQRYFAHYGIEPPVTPILQPEFVNPLYLQLVCKTLKSKELTQMPTGWLGIAQAIKAFLAEKDRLFALSYEGASGASLVSRSLLTVAQGIASSDTSALTWSIAERLIREQHENAPRDILLTWMVREDLLIEDAPQLGDTIGSESVVRPAFERLGDFLIAQEVLRGLDQANLAGSCGTNGRLSRFLGSPEAIASNQGVVSVLSILVPEETAKGTELPDYLPDGPIRTSALKAAIASYPWRDPASFSPATESNLREGLAMHGFAYDATDAALAISWADSVIDALWFHKFLSGKKMARRDAFWCHYLHERFEGLSPVRRLIEAAFELPLNQVAPAVAERWATILVWFTAAADRRVKDRASRAATTVLIAHVDVLSTLIHRMLIIDDDAILERALLTTYGACVCTHDRKAVAAVCQVLADAIRKNPARFHNALLRDHSRSIAELAQQLGEQQWHDEVARRLDSLKSPWPLDLPTDDAVKEWEQLPRLVSSCCDDDFFFYSMGCLDRWESCVSRKDMAKWILKRIIDDFGYLDSGCKHYDGYMVQSFGFGRGKPTWAERIGKKYQWIAMNELAARLEDHASQKPRSSGPKLLRKPLILLRRRELDPTLPHKIVVSNEDRTNKAWWIPAFVDLELSSELSNKTWSEKEDDVPELVALLTPFRSKGADWRLLAAFMRWGQPSDDYLEKPYRQIWTHVRAFAVDSDDSDIAFSCLCGRNFFGRWMPEGPSWCYGFAAEYPWGAPFNTEPDEWHGMGGHEHDFPCTFLPINNQVAVEWEYDASLSGSLHLNVPARFFFDSGDLWWDNRDGFRRLGGRTVFRDPSATELGPSALIADVSDLLSRLQQTSRRLIWTLLGEKWIIGGRRDCDMHRRTFSQVALANEDGSLEVSDLVFFDDYDQAKGPALDISTNRKVRGGSNSSSK